MGAWIETDNNLYEIGERHLNANHEEVEQLIAEDRKDEAKSLVGYFNKHGSVKMLKLLGCPSIGILLRPAALVNWNSELANVNWEEWFNKGIDKKIKGLQKKKSSPYDKSGTTAVKRLSDRKIKNYTIGYDDVYSLRFVINNVDME